MNNFYKQYQLRKNNDWAARVFAEDYKDKNPQDVWNNYSDVRKTMASNLGFGPQGDLLAGWNNNSSSSMQPSFGQNNYTPQYTGANNNFNASSQPSTSPTSYTSQYSAQTGYVPQYSKINNIFNSAPSASTKQAAYEPPAANNNQLNTSSGAAEPIPEYGFGRLVRYLKENNLIPSNQELTPLPQSSSTPSSYGTQSNINNNFSPLPQSSFNSWGGSNTANSQPATNTWDNNPNVAPSGFGANAWDRTKCLANGYSHGVTYGFSDELAGMAGVAGNGVANLVTGQNLAANSADAYSEVRDDLRNHLEACRTKYPLMTYGAEVGGLLSSPVNFIKASTRAPLKYQKVAELENALAKGAFWGAGTGKGNLKDQGLNVAINGLLGGTIIPLRRNLFSWLAPTAGGGIEGLIRRQATDNMLQNLLESILKKDDKESN